LKQWKAEGKPLEIMSGRNAGKINPALVGEFEKSITGVFHDYTRKDPDLGVPANVRGIAITEVRTNIDATKEAYHTELERKNIDIMKMMKTWIQNKSFSKKFRKEHSVVNGVTIAKSDLFKVPSPNGGFDLMAHPHVAGAPANQVIGCNCDTVYKAILI
jgi:hypothetical protein